MKKSAPRAARASSPGSGDAAAPPAGAGAETPAGAPSGVLPLRLSGRALAAAQHAALPLPRALQPVNRSGQRAAPDPLLAGLAVTQRVELGSRQRGAAAQTVEPPPPPDVQALLALETQDGQTLYVRADALSVAVARLRPDAVQNGAVDLARFGPAGGPSRGVPELLWKAVSTLRLPQDALLDEATDLALQWAKDWLGEQLEDAAYAAGSHLGSKALIWSIESRLAGNEGLYLWRGAQPEARDRCEPGDKQLIPMTEGQPALLLIHGVASTSAGSFGDLQRDADTWAALQRAYPGGIFGFEHRSFSASPVQNALALLDALPDHARFSLLTHSRGGLVGDLLCLDNLDPAAIGQFRFAPPEDASPLDRLALERASKDEQQRLRTLARRLKTKPFQVERYLRVASPAQGTRLLSDNLDVALSDLLGLLQWGGSGAARLLAGAVAGPAAAVVAGQTASSWLGVVQRLVLEIAARRIHPHHMPGIAAMRTDAPLARLLAHPGSGPRNGLQMAVIAGDTEFRRLGLSHLGRRLANLFCDWRLFDQQDNDLVVDTDAMFAGLAPRAGARYRLEQGEEVSHFNYFGHLQSQRGVLEWLTLDDPKRADFEVMKPVPGPAWSDLQPVATVQRSGPGTPRRRRPADLPADGDAQAQTSPDQPVVILVPGFMQSRLAARLPAGATLPLWPNLDRLAQDGLAPLADLSSGHVLAEAPLEAVYAPLAQHLAKTHTVLPFGYDWRLPLAASASALKDLVDRAAKDHPGQPIRLLGHGSGGLVVRRLMLDHPASWQQVLDTGGRLLTLGTPHHGSHAVLYALLGKDPLVRELALVAPGGLRPVLDTLAGWPGLLAWLPCPDSAAVAPATERVSDPAPPSQVAPAAGPTAPADGDASDWTQPDHWAGWQRTATDPWFGAGGVGVPSAAALHDAARQWQDLHNAATGLALPDPQRVLCVLGQGKATPCGAVREASSRWRLSFTAHGDGAVTWASGQWPGAPRPQQTWLMPVPYDELTGHPDHFEAIAELLATGHTLRLARLPTAGAGQGLTPSPDRTRGAQAASALDGDAGVATDDRHDPGAKPFTLDAGPPVLPIESRLAHAGFGFGRSRRPRGRNPDRLRVSVRAGDLMYTDQPVLCGHYVGDAISGAEAALDRLLQGGLSERERLGQYAADIGTSVVLLRPQNLEEKRRHTLRGAVIVGLGAFNGQISGRTLTDAVRAGAIRYLLHLRDAMGAPAGQPIKLYSLLLGWSSNASLNIGESVAAVVLGVLEANQQLRQAAGQRRERARAITELGFLELYRDTAISAAHEVLALPQRLGSELQRFDWRLDPAPVLEDAEGVRERLSVLADQGHWSRFIVTDPDADASALSVAAPASHAPTPGAASAALPGPAAADAFDAPTAEVRRYPQRLKFVYLSRRARAESVDQRRQPGLIEDLIRAQRFETAHNARLGNTLFQLMVPLDFKGIARESARTLLVLDSYAASLPWELMQVDSQPIALRAPLLRQLATSQGRQVVASANVRSACIIANPSTQGFRRRFPGAAVDALDDLRGAAEEGIAIEALLRDAGWVQVTPADEQLDALAVFTRLYERPYKVLVIAAHGLFEAEGNDGQRYTGAVLSDGLLLTAEEVRQMETVPDLVFLSCCHLGQLSDRAGAPGRHPLREPNRLAYSLSQQLIEMGVRCVVAAGWAVADDAACTFATTLFGSLVDGVPFGDAVFEARKQTYEQHPGTNTWGAYQAYGDPGYRLQGQAASDGSTKSVYVAREELLAALAQRLQAVKRPGARTGFADEQTWVRQQLEACPPEWVLHPEVQQAQARLFAELGRDGFAAAQSAYLQAIQRDDLQGRVGVKCIEQLANLEVRTGARLAGLDEDQDRLPAPANRAQGIALIEQGIARIQALNQSVAGLDTGARITSETAHQDIVNTERAALLGSAYKRLAVVQAMDDGATWDRVHGTLRHAVWWYRQAIRDDPAHDPYHTLNALPLDWLCQPLHGDERAVDNAATLALRCAEQARRRHAEQGDFWSAVMGADAQLTAWFMNGQWPDRGDGTDQPVRPDRHKPPSEQADPDVAAWEQVYLHASQDVPRSSRQWDSVIRQWQQLALLLRLRRQHGAGAMPAHDGETESGQTAAAAAGDAQPPADADQQALLQAWDKRAHTLGRLAERFTENLKAHTA